MHIAIGFDAVAEGSGIERDWGSGVVDLSLVDVK